jgi:hypothetical protein
MDINQKDKNIIKGLMDLEQTGEDAFSPFNFGDKKAKEEIIKNALSQSAKNIETIQDPELRKTAQSLFRAMDDAIRTYKTNPSGGALMNAQDAVGKYKSFLDNCQKDY